MSAAPQAHPAARIMAVAPRFPLCRSRGNETLGSVKSGTSETPYVVSYRPGGGRQAWTHRRSDPGTSLRRRGALLFREGRRPAVPGKINLDLGSYLPDRSH